MAVSELKCKLLAMILLVVDTCRNCKGVIVLLSNNRQVPRELGTYMLFLNCSIWLGLVEKNIAFWRSSFFQKCPMLIVLNGLSKVLSHGGDGILEFRGNSTKEKTLIATLRVYNFSGE